MLLKYFYDKNLAQASYLVGCQACGEALIIDPLRQIQPYLAAAEAEGMRILHATETHIHADFASGIREFAALGARIYLSDMGDDDWKYRFPPTPNTQFLKDGDVWMVGNVRLEAIHTPGHTPEHLSFLITDTLTADQPMAILSGDFIFVGDVGRPDLLDEIGGKTDTREAGAKLLYQSIQLVKSKPDFLMVLPGHGAGSACGKALGAVPSSSLGYEKLFNPAFQFTDEDAFVKWLLEGQPEAPRYFGQMKKVNKHGLPLLADLPPVPHLPRSAVDELLSRDALLIDYRNRSDFVRGHLPNSLSIPASSSNLLTYTGWFVDYEQPLYLLVYEPEDAEWIIDGLRNIGVDQIGGYFTPEVIPHDAPTLPTIKAANLSHLDKPLIVDVRGLAEYEAKHYPDAIHIPLGYLPQHLDELPRDHPLVMQCNTGYRSQIAASVLRRHGFQNVLSLDDRLENLLANKSPHP